MHMLVQMVVYMLNILLKVNSDNTHTYMHTNVTQLHMYIVHQD